MPDAPRSAFHAPAARVAWFSDVICRALPTDAAVRVLDIGCGAGDQLFDLAPRLPRARLVGVDIAAANVDEARRRQAAHPARERLAFDACDYRAFRTREPFDVLLSYSVLQFVPGGADALAARVAEDAAPGALFFNVMPYRCAYNGALALARRLLRAVRGPAADRLLLAIGRALHGASLEQPLLAERVAYAYAVPDQLEDDLARALERRGFATERREAVAHASPAQMKHALRVMRRGLTARA